MKISSGEYEVVESGTVISYRTNPISFHFAPELLIRVVFSYDERQGDNVIEFRPIEGAGLEMSLVNFNSELDTGNTYPIEVGYLNGRRLFLNFRLRTLSHKESRSFDYSWYLGSEYINTTSQAGQNG